MHDRDRHYLTQYLDIIDQPTNKTLGYLGDLSEKGLMFISQTSIPPEQIKDNHICINIDELEIKKQNINSKIKTHWVKPNINPDLFCIGCTFLEIAPSDKKQLDKLSAVFNFKNNITINRVKSKDA